MLTDYHVHMAETGKLEIDYLKKYVEKAHAEGIQEFGISEHAYFFDETKNILSNPWVDNRRTLEFKEYQALFDEVKKEGLPVKMGMEIDYMPGKEKEIAEFINAHPFDYTVGSVHWIRDWGVDNADWKDEYDKRDIKTVYKEYFDQIVTLAESDLCSFVGHIDLIKIFNYRPDDDAFVEEQYDRAVAALAKSNTCVEISTAGLRKPVGRIYPEPLFLQKLYDAGIGIVLSSDAHMPKHIGYAYDRALELARSVGYTEIQTFDQQKRKSMPLG